MMTEHDVVAVVEGLTVRRLRAWVRQGWVRPTHRGGKQVYTEVDTARLRLICQLREDLNVNEDAVPVVLSLVDQVYGMRHELRCLVHALEAQSPNVRDRVIDHVRRIRSETT